MRLSPVLTTRDFDIAELSGMRLLGVLRAVGESWVAADEPMTLETRADVVAATLLPRQIADRWTAAWVWGAVDTLRTPYESCVAKTPRTSPRRRRSSRAPGDAPSTPSARTTPGPGPVSLPSARLLAMPSRAGIRELDLWAGEVSEVRELRVTSPMRTAVDLLREADADSGWADAVLQLVRLDRKPAHALSELRELLSGQRFAVHARATAPRLAEIEGSLIPTPG